MIKNVKEQENSLVSLFKNAIEAVSPELRRYMKAEMQAQVENVNDNNEEDNYYTLDVSLMPDGDTADREEREIIKSVPVDSVWSEDGYGIWVLPEVDSFVTICFDNFEKTQPRITMSRPNPDKALPTNYKAGQFIIAGRKGQRIIFEKDTNELKIAAASLKEVATILKQSYFGDKKETIKRDLEQTIDRHKTINIAGDKNETITGKHNYSSGPLEQEIIGGLTQNIAGGITQQIGASINQSIGGSVSRAILFNAKDIVTGQYNLMVLGTPGIYTPNPLYPAYNVNVMGAGGISLNCLGGIVGIGDQELMAPSILNIGSSFAGATFVNGVTVQLGGTEAVPSTEPLVLGNLFKIWMTELITALQGPLQTGNIGVPTAPNPAFTAQLITLQAKMESLIFLSKRVLTSIA